MSRRSSRKPTSGWVVEDYLIFKLTGNYATDYSTASRTMGFDVTRRAWSEEVFAAADLDPSVMAEAHPSGTPVGTIGGDVAALTGLAAGIYADYEAAARAVYRVERELDPDAGRHERYDRCYRDIYCHLYPSLSGLNAAIAGASRHEAA